MPDTRHVEPIWCGPWAVGELTGAGPRRANRVLEEIQGGPVVATHMAALCESLRRFGWRVKSLRNYMHQRQSLIENLASARDESFVYVVKCEVSGILDAATHGEHMAAMGVGHCVAVNQGQAVDSVCKGWRPVSESPWANSQVVIRVAAEPDEPLLEDVSSAVAA